MNQGLAFVIVAGVLGYGVYIYQDGQNIAKKADDADRREDAAFVAKNHDYYAAFCKAYPDQECCQRNSNECALAGKRVVAGQ